MGRLIRTEYDPIYRIKLILFSHICTKRPVGTNIRHIKLEKKVQISSAGFLGIWPMAIASLSLESFSIHITLIFNAFPALQSLKFGVERSFYKRYDCEWEICVRT